MCGLADSCSRRLDAAAADQIWRPKKSLDQVSFFQLRDRRAARKDPCARLGLLIRSLACDGLREGGRNPLRTQVCAHEAGGFSGRCYLAPAVAPIKEPTLDELPGSCSLFSFLFLLSSAAAINFWLPLFFRPETERAREKVRQIIFINCAESSSKLAGVVLSAAAAGKFNLSPPQGASAAASAAARLEFLGKQRAQSFSYCCFAEASRGQPKVGPLARAQDKQILSQAARKRL